MDVEWRLQKQQALQGGVNIGRGFEILPANNMGDALNGIIHDNRQMIGSQDIFPHKNNIPPPIELNGTSSRSSCSMFKLAAMWSLIASSHLR